MAYWHRRLYFLLPDVKTAKRVMRELLLARVEERHIHVVAKEGTALGDLPPADLFERSDALHGAGIGSLTGGATGAVAGTVAYFFPPSGLSLGLGVVLATSVIGAIMGFWVAGMIGADAPNTHLRRFDHDLKKGKLLMIIDVPKPQVERITELVKGHHPEADLRGVDPTIPPFP